ncbi:hypothetical protein AB0P28_14755 [Pseudarthrobacter sp. NPDC089323]
MMHPRNDGVDSPFVNRSFFIPGFETDSAAAEAVYIGTMKNLPDEVSAARLQRLDYQHKGRTYSARVGEEEERGQGVVFAIFGPSKIRQMYYVATFNRGVRRGEAMYIGLEEVTAVIEFSAD